MKETAIVMKSVHKKFKKGHKIRSLAILARDIMKGQKKRKTIALKNVSLKIKKGEKVGLIGANGSGKTTILRLIAGISEKDSGIIKTRGEVFLLSGMNNGLQDQLTLRQNAFIVGPLLGMSNKQMLKKLKGIVEYAGLQGFEDTPLYKFSTGMKKRFAFSISYTCIINKKPDIILLDEVFGGGGDIKFRKQSTESMKKLLDSDITLVVVSHRLEHIEQLCDRVIWIDKGILLKDGNTSEVTTEFSERMSD